MTQPYKIEGDTIIIKRELTDLDLFVKSFLDILKEYSNYLVVSGFVSISTGRTRGTEDVDILIPLLEKSKFAKLFKGLQENGFWCYQGDEGEEVYSYYKEMISIRFAKNNTMFPNIELVPFNETKKAKFFEFNHPQKIRIKDFEFKIPPIEFEILYKEIILAGKKDLEDARHLRTLFSDILKQENFKNYEVIIKKELK